MLWGFFFFFGWGFSRFQFPSKLIFWNLLSVQSQFPVCLLVKWLEMAVSDVIPCHSCDYHRYADDTEISDSAPPSDFTSAQSNVQSCISDTLSWMQSSKLKLSTEKTEMMLVGSWVRISLVDWKSADIGGSRGRVGDGFSRIWHSKHSGEGCMVCVCVGGRVGTERNGIKGW